MGDVSVEIKLRSVDSLIRQKHGSVRLLTIREQNILTEYAYSIVREVENDWPILTGYSIVRWAPRLDLGAGNSRIFIENAAWYADWVHSKGVRRSSYRWLGRPLYQDLVASAWERVKPHLIRDMKLEIERTEKTGEDLSGPQKRVITWEELSTKYSSGAP
jgi:hypothetical protein